MFELLINRFFIVFDLNFRNSVTKAKVGKIIESSKLFSFFFSFALKKIPKTCLFSIKVLIFAPP